MFLVSQVKFHDDCKMKYCGFIDAFIIVINNYFLRFYVDVHFIPSVAQNSLFTIISKRQKESFKKKKFGSLA